MNTNEENTPYLKKILVVDDTQTNRVIIKGLLKKRGFDVLEAGDGLEALAVYQNEAPDLVLMDVMMPGIDGYETARRMRALPGENWVPIIFVSASAARRRPIFLSSREGKTRRSFGSVPSSSGALLSTPLVWGPVFRWLTLPSCKVRY